MLVFNLPVGMGLCGKLAKSVIWSTFAPLDSDLSTGQRYPPFEQLGLGVYTSQSKIDNG